MPRGGHNRKPDEVKALEGTLRGDRVNPSAPKVTPCRVPGPPRTIDPGEAAHWRQLAREVKALGVYHASNYTAFALLVKLRALVDSDDKDLPPTARAKLTQTCAGMLAQFGLTPASRGRVPIAGKTEQDEAERKLFGRPSLRAVGGGDG